MLKCQERESETLDVHRPCYSDSMLSSPSCTHIYRHCKYYHNRWCAWLTQKCC